MTTDVTSHSKNGHEHPKKDVISPSKPIYFSTSDNSSPVKFGDEICSCCGSFYFGITKHWTKEIIKKSLIAAFDFDWRWHKGIFVTTLDLSEIVKETPELQTGKWETIKTRNGDITVNILDVFPEGVNQDELPYNHPRDIPSWDLEIDDHKAVVSPFNAFGTLEP